MLVCGYGYGCFQEDCNPGFLQEGFGLSLLDTPGIIICCTFLEDPASLLCFERSILLLYVNILFADALPVFPLQGQKERGNGCVFGCTHMTFTETRSLLSVKVFILDLNQTLSDVKHVSPKPFQLDSHLETDDRPCCPHETEACTENLFEQM